MVRETHLFHLAETESYFCFCFVLVLGIDPRDALPLSYISFLEPVLLSC